MSAMAQKKGLTQARKSNVNLAPLSPDEAISAIFRISQSDVKRIISNRPGKKRKSK